MGSRRARHADAKGPAGFPVPEYGPHDLNPPANRDLWHPAPVVHEEESDA